MEYDNVYIGETIILIPSFVSFLVTKDAATNIIYFCFLFLILNMISHLRNIKRQTNKQTYFF